MVYICGLMWTKYNRSHHLLIHRHWNSFSRGIGTHRAVRIRRPPRIGAACERHLGITPIVRPILLDGEIRVVGEGAAILVRDLIGVAIPHQRIVPAVRLRAHDVPVPDAGLQAPGDGVVVFVVGGAAADSCRGGPCGCGDGEGRVQADAEGYDFGDVVRAAKDQDKARVTKRPEE